MDSPVEQVKQFLQAVLLRKRLFIIVSASVALLAVTGSFLIPAKYEAKSTVFIERHVIDSLMKGIAVTPSIEERIRVLRYYMTSRDVVSRTLKKMEIDTLDSYQNPDVFEKLIASCQERTTINMKEKNDLFIVSINDVNPYFARDFINTLISAYVESNLAQKREESYGATRFLSEQVIAHKKKLDEIDAKIIEFRKKVGIFSNASETSIIEQIARDQEALKAIQLKKNELMASIATIEQQLKMIRKTTAYGFGAETGGDPIAKIRQLQSKVDELLLTYNDKHPSVVKLRDQIEELRNRQQINQEAVEPVVDDASYNAAEDPIFVDLKMRLNLNQSELNALLANERDLHGRIATAEKTLRNFPEDKKILNDLERERANYGAIYEQILQRVGISEVSKDMEVADKSTTFRIVDPAILPTTPVGVKRIMLMLAGLFAGIAAGLGTVFALENLDNSIKDSRSIKELGIAVLAEIPLIIGDTENLLNQKKDKAVYTFASVCTVFVGILILYDLLGFTFIDSLLGHFKAGTAYRSPYGS
jgi:polysaccharide chain length determinant protein (PEP-CTERM system associated)